MGMSDCLERKCGWFNIDYNACGIRIIPYAGVKE
jgi:hypothetical protein